MTRKQDWDTRDFHAFLLSGASTPFTWGANDCASFSADGIHAITGVDIMSDLRGYKTNAGAMKMIHDVTGESTLEDAVVWCANKHGMTERKHPLTAQRGDLVLYNAAPDIIACGLVHLNGRHIVSPGESGLLRLPITTVHRAFTY